VLGVPTLIHGRDEAGTLLRNAQKQQTKDLAHVAGLENQTQRQASWQAKLESYETDIDALKAKLDSVRRERAALDDELEKVDSVHQAKIRSDYLINRRKEITSSQKDHSEERLTLLRDVWRDLLQPKLQLKQAFLFSEQQKITSQMDERSKLDAKAADLRNFLETATCPTCGQLLHESKRANAGAELGKIEAKMSANSIDHRGLTRVSAEIQEIGRLLRAGVGPRIGALDMEVRKIGVELTKVENEIELISKQIKGYDTAEIARKRSLRDGTLREEGQLERSIAADQKSIEDVKKELAIIAKALQSLPQARASRSTVMVRICTGLERIFSESVERLRTDLRRHVQARATEAFKMLTTQKAYQGLEINQNYGLNILDERGTRVTVRSAGAEQIVALSLIDGLARTGRAAGPVVMDTPFGRLDLRHRDNILRYLPTTTSQLILLVHDGEIRRETDLEPIAGRIGAAYEIREVNPRHSRIEKVIS